MLKMKCPNCSEFIVSKLLAEIDTIECEHCGQSVPVADVMVFAKGFTFHRDDLAKRLFRYKSLINEVLQERNLLEKNAQASAESKKSLDQFLMALREVMDGARTSLRLEFNEPLPILVEGSQGRHLASLVNLSTTGACLTTSSVPASQFKKRDQITLVFRLLQEQEDYLLKGTVIWTAKPEAGSNGSLSIGVEFMDVQEKIKRSLWDYISKTATA